MRYSTLMAIALLAYSLTAVAQQTDTENFVLSQTYKQSGSVADGNNVSKVVTQIQYIDGLGRPVQTVRVKQNPAGLDLVTPIAYDALGRQSSQYLPYAVNGNGGYQGSATTAAATWYTNNTARLQKALPTDLNRPFTEFFFEQSPLNRATGQQEPGGKSNPSSIQYKVNDGAEVKRYDVDGDTVRQNGSYLAGALLKRVFLDEQAKETTEFTDKLGQVICKKVKASDSEMLTTYYVFDDLRQMRFILQPNFQDANPVRLVQHAITYKYDERGRVIEKRLPGTKYPIEIVYDQYDRPVLTRDAVQQQNNKWAFTKYDAMNRPIVTGELASSNSRATWANSVNTGTQHHEDRANGTVAGYTLNKTAPTTATEADLLTITFYDDYGFTATGLGYTNVYYPSNNANVKGQQTGGRTRILQGGSATPGNWLTSAVYYDGEYRAIQVVRNLHDLGANATERVSTEYKYDLAAVASKQKTEQTVTGATNSHLAEYSYDHSDRLLGVKETVAFGSLTKAAFTLSQRYNALGQLQSKWLHAKPDLPTQYRRMVRYTYNIRGWMTDALSMFVPIQYGPSKTFSGVRLFYENASNSKYTNGNISKIMLRYREEGAPTKGISFSYDGANRMIGSSGLGDYPDVEGVVSYDKSGNILTLQRSGEWIDNLSYTYSNFSNRLEMINDGSGNNKGVKSGASAAYKYDENGNMTTDGNRSAVITYNYLNLPKTVAMNAKTFTYDYDASGNKLKYIGDGLTVKYAGRFEYDGSNSLKRIAISDGQVLRIPVAPSPASDSLRFEYYIKDHLGNVRVVVDEFGGTRQLNDYYPFGGAISRDDATITEVERNAANRYRYNGKEIQIGSGYVDYGARMYMPELGRWGVHDPLEEKWAVVSPYSYTLNNPMNLLDPDGMDVKQLGAWTRLSGIDAQLELLRLQEEEEARRKDKKDPSKTTKSADARVAPIGLDISEIDPMILAKTGVAVKKGTGNTMEQTLFLLGLALDVSSGGFIEMIPKGWLVKFLPKWLLKQAVSQVDNVAKAVELMPTHGMTMSKSAFKKLVDDIAKNGIIEPIKYIEHNGVKYVVDGHHRLRAANILRIENVPVQEVKFPFGQYKTPQDLIYSN